MLGQQWRNETEADMPLRWRRSPRDQVTRLGWLVRFGGFCFATDYTSFSPCL